MQFQSRLAIFLPLLATLAVAAPVADASAAALKRSDLPEGCAFVNNDPSSHAITCEYTSPHADAHPVISSNIPGSCVADASNPYNVTCHVPGPPKSFGISKRSANPEPKELDTSYKFSLICDDNGCTKTTGKAKREAVAADGDPEAYKFSISIEWKRDVTDVVDMVKRADDAVDAEAYKLGIVIEWKRSLEEMAKREVATNAEEAYKFSITIEW